MTYRCRNWYFRGLQVVVLLAFPADEARGQTADREWIITPYVWLSNLSGRNVVGQRQVVVGDSSLTPAAALRVETHRRRLGFRLAATWATLDNPGTVSSVTDPTLETPGRYDFSWTTVEAHTSLQIGPLHPASSFQVYFGFRYVHQSQSLRDVAGAETSASQVWLEPVEGSQYSVRVGRRFRVTIAGDIGGFAVGSDFTWTLNGELAFRAAAPLDLTMRYSFREVQYDNKEAGAKAYRWDGGVQQGWFFGAALRLPSR